MSPAERDALIALAEHVPKEHVASLAILYDKFANAIDPFHPDTDQAYKIFTNEVMRWYDDLGSPKPSFHDFRKAVIIRCKRHLSATDRHSGI